MTIINLRVSPLRLLLLLLTLAWALSAAAQAASKADASTVDASTRIDWELVKRNDGIMIYMAQLPDEHLKTFRGVTTIKLDDFTAIGAIMDDYSFVASWMHMVSTIDGIARTSPSDRLVYVTTRLPWPVNNRDVVLHVGLQQDPVSYALSMPMHSVDNVKPPQKGYVRMPKMQSYFLFEPLEPGKVRVTLQVIVDPGGYIPDWMANLLMRDIPYYSLKHLSVVANDPRFRHQHLNYYQVPPAWLAAAKLKDASGSSTKALP